MSNQFDDLAERARKIAADSRDEMKEKIGQLRERPEWNEARELASGLAEEAAGFVRKYPLQSVLGAALGFLLGAFTGRKRRRFAMNWSGLLGVMMQFLNLRRSLVESQALIEAAQLMAERGKRFLISFLGIFFASIFLFSGFLVAVIELGLQIDRDGHLSYSGLMISATILLGIGFLIALLSLFEGLSQPAPIPRAEPPRSPREDRIKDLLEEFLVVFLTNLANGQGDKKKD